MSGAITSTMLGTIASLAIGCGYVLRDNQDINDLGAVFWDYVEYHKNLTWETVNLAFSSCVALNKSGLVEIDTPFLDIVKDFFDSWSFKENNQPKSFGWIGGIPYYYSHDISCTEPIGLWVKMTDEADFDIPFKIGIWTFTYKKANYNGVKLVYEGYRNNYYGSTNFSEGEINIDGCYFYVIRNTSSSAWPYSLYTCYKQTDGTIKREEVCDFNPDVYVPEVPNTGRYDWGKVKEHENEDGSIAIPVPNDLGGLVNGDTSVPEWGDTLWDGTHVTTPDNVYAPDVENVGVDVIVDSFPGVVEDNPSIDIPGTPIIPPIIPPIEGDDIPEGSDGELGENPTDNWGNQNSGGLYYYYIGTDVSDSTIDNVIGHAVGVVSLSYTPYLWYSDCNITKIPYDSERFNKTSNFSNFYVYRINDVSRPVKKVGGFTAYSNNFSVNTGEGQPFNYMNETKLYQYPYSFAYVYDGINNPLEIKYHYLPYVYNDVYIKQTVSDKCTYGIFVKDYKGDHEGNLESMVLTSGNELPCSSSTYAQWFATNRNQMSQNIQNVLTTNAIQSQGALQQYEIQKDMSSLNMIGGLAGAIGSLFTYNIGGVGSGLSSALNTANMLKSQQVSLNTQLALNKQNDQNAIQSAMALNNDMRNAPPTLVSHGSNVFYGILNNNKQLLLLRMGLSDVDYYRLGTYFTMYGYKQNKIMNINLRSRKYFNYFKITAPNIVSTNVPHAQVEKIKEIFKEGITLWHYENSNKVLDYFHSDNYEV